MLLPIWFYEVDTIYLWRILKLVIMEQYVEKIELNHGAFKVAIQDGDKLLWGMIDKDGNIIVPCKYDDVRPGYNFFDTGELCIETYNLVKKNGLWGIRRCWGFYDADLDDDSDIDFIFEDISQYYRVGVDEAEFPVAKYNGFWGVGFPSKPLVPFIYDEISRFLCYNDLDPEIFRSCTWAIAQYKGKLGVIQVFMENCIELVPFLYDSIYFHFDSVCKTILVKKNDLWGVLDYKGNQVMPCIYEDFEYVGGIYLKVKSNGVWSFIDIMGNKVKESDMIFEEDEEDNKMDDVDYEQYL